MSIGSKNLILFFLGEINKLRAHPKAFLQIVQDRLACFDKLQKMIYFRPDIPTISYRTSQGEQAVKQTYNFLLNQAEGQPLQLSYQLCQIAFQVGGQICKSAKQKTINEYEKRLKQQILKNNCTVDNLQVIIEYGFGMDHQLLPTILIDDGDTRRCKRNAVMNHHHRYIGLAVHAHSEFDYQLTILLAYDVKQLNSSSSKTCECVLI